MLTRDRRLRDKERPTLAILLCWITGTLFLLALSLTPIAEHRLPDADDAMRLARVRDLLAGQGWFAPATGSVAAWSRLADLPLAGLILLLSPMLEAGLAERVAMIALPLLALLLVMLAIGRLAWRLFDRQTAGYACLVLLLLPGIALQFQPLRIDHHGWQILALAVASWALVWRVPGKGGSAAGLAMAAGLIVSLDLALMALAIGLVCAVRWLRDHRERWWLVSYLQALAMGLVVLFALTRGLGAIAPACDMISPPLLGAVIILALGTGAMAVLPALPRLPLVLGWAGFSVLGIGFAALFAPQCLVLASGEASAFLPGVWPGPAHDAGPLWRSPPTVAVPALVQLVLALGVALYLASIQRDWQRAWWFDYALLLLIALLGSLLAARTLGFAGAMSALPLGWFIARLRKRWRAHDGLVAKLVVAMLLVLVVAPGALLTLAQMARP